MIVDGGNSKWTESIARHAQCAEHGDPLRRRRDERRRLGARGRLLHDGRRRAASRSIALAPILDVLAPPDGWGRMGGPGSGHYVKMVHNGIEYGADAGLRRGLRAAAQVRVRARRRADREAVGPGLGRPLMAARAGGAGLRRADGNDLHALEGYVEDSGEGRWTLQSGIDHDVPMPALTGGAVRTLLPRAATATTPHACWRRCAISSAAMP